MREIEAEQIKAQRYLEMYVSDLFKDAERHVRKSDLTGNHSRLFFYSAVTVVANIAVSLITSLATAMVYCEYHHLLK